MSNLDWIIVVLYLGAIIAVGRYFARRQRNMDDYFRGSGNLPWLAVALSVVASLASTVGYLGTPGEVIQNGIGILIGQLAIPAAILVIVFIIVPFYKRANVTTAFELLGARYGSSTRMLSVIIWAYMQIAFLGLVMLLASRLIADMTGIPVLAVILVIGLASVLYTSAGGMQSVVWTDVFQFVILFLGAVVAIGVIAARTDTGPGDWWREMAGQTHDLPPWFSRDLATRHTVLGTLFAGFVINIAYASSEQVVVQRYGATRRAVTMMLANYGVAVIFTLLQIALGAALVVFYLKVPDALPADVGSATDANFADQAFPHFIVHHLPIGLTGMVIAALLGAAQSTVDSGVNSMSAVISTDVIPFIKNNEFIRWLDRIVGVSEIITKYLSGWKDNELQSARGSARTVGVGVVIMAIVAENLPGANNIVDIAQKVVHLGLGPLGALFLVTMIVRYVGTAAANISVVGGFSAAVFFAFAKNDGDNIISPILIIPMSWLVTAVLALLLGMVLQKKPTVQPTNE